MERKIYNDLLNWKASTDRKPLILQGARQVGKTYIVNIFGEREYANVVYCNFEKDGNLKEFFNNLEPIMIIKKLANYKRKEIMPQNTLIIFDEIQACPEALTSLKYFCEEANNFHIIAMGSLLGVSVHRQKFSFPVGKVEFLNMYPMDFEEFLMANNEDFLIEQIKNCYNQNTALENGFHERALEYYKNYLFVGGMPDVVGEFLKHKNYEIIKIKQQNILDAYFDDMGKYNKESEIPKTRLVYKNVSTQLAKQNKKFKYSALKSGGRASEFANAIEWLSLAGIAGQLFRVEQIKVPLNAYKSIDDFKFYMNDVGLCCASQDILIDDILFDNAEITDFKGGLTENYVNNQLICNNFNAYYWTSNNQAEIDFIVRIGKDIIPIEVKSSDNIRSRSLGEYAKKFKPVYVIRISSKNFGFENGIKSVPLYATFCIS
ncbi:MAG: ATP-binding protein [Clostridia bacterium]|nr:ATP-binding protein [Clostridia bacterium]